MELIEQFMSLNGIEWFTIIHLLTVAEEYLQKNPLVRKLLSH